MTLELALRAVKPRNCHVNANGDVASIFDKTINRELLSAPIRLAISYDNPKQWPAWNMDWDQEQAAPKAYVVKDARS